MARATIKNRSAYSAAFKLACIEDFRVTTKSVTEFVVGRNISASTMRLWAKDAGISTKKAKRVITSGSKEVVPRVQASGEITYKGKVYTAK